MAGLWPRMIVWLSFLIGAGASVLPRMAVDASHGAATLDIPLTKLSSCGHFNWQKGFLKGEPGREAETDFSAAKHSL